MATSNNFFDNMSRRAGEVAREGLSRAKVFLGIGDSATSGAANPNVAAEGSAEAKAFRSSGAGNPKFPGYAEGSPMNPSPAPTGMRALAPKLARGAAAITPIAEGAEAASNIAQGENPLKAVGRASLRGGATMLGTLGGAALGSGVASVPLAAAGGYGGYKLGDMVAESLFGKAPPGGAQAAPTQEAPQPEAPRNGGVMVGRSSMEAGDSLNGQRIPLANENADARPEALAASNSTLVPAGGYGVIKRTTPGNEGPATAVGNGLGSQPVQTATQPGAAAAGGSTGLREVPVLAGNNDYVVNRRNQDAQIKGREQDVQREAAAATALTARSRLAYDLGNDNAKKVDARTDDYVRKSIPIPAASPTGIGDSSTRAKYDADVKQRASEVKERIRYSLSDRKDGKTPETLSESEHSQLLIANDLRDRIEKAREGGVQSMRDFFGNKRFDSRNLYSYMPTKAERAVNGGYVVHFANGNTAHVVDTAGGEFRLFGPNTPVDADVMAIIKPYIDRARAGGR